MPPFPIPPQYKNMKTNLFLLTALLLAACNRLPANQEAEHSQDAIIVSQDIEYTGGHACISEDGRFAIESGTRPNGGTSPEYWSVWTIQDEAGRKHRIEHPYSSYQSQVHSLQKDDGATYYLVNCSMKASSREGYEWMEAYKIVGQTVEQVNAIDGSSLLKKDQQFLFRYDIPAWYFATQGAGYDWILEYDSCTRELYRPLTTEDYEITDRYQVYQFDGKQFIDKGERHNKHLHPSLAQYERLLQYCTTEHYIVRVDKLPDGQLRYASWAKPSTMQDKPDMVLTGGKIVSDEENASPAPSHIEYHFTRGNHHYIVNYSDSNHHDCLLVKKGEKVIIKEDILK